MEIQTLYQKAIVFATEKHTAHNQTIPGTTLPYVVHLSNVAMEILLAAQHTTGFDTGFAVQVALLHDVLEDTSTIFEELATTFTLEIAESVAALTKNDQLPKNEKMLDSLHRIKACRKEVWSVKLANRIINLQAPPKHWSSIKIKDYLQEAALILQTLKGGNAYLENRLQQKMIEYSAYLH